jgi:Domain of unknown function (DUF3883)
MEKLRREFVRLYPPSTISRLTLDHYVQGKGSKESFCYWLERKTADLGHIQGAPAIKFGVFYNKKNNRYKFKGNWPNAQAALKDVQTEIVRLIDASSHGDLGEIRSVDLSPMVKGKLLFLYHPSTFINIFSERHVDHYLGRLRLNDPGAKLDLIAKKERLAEFKNSDAVMKAWTMFEFSDFLYHFWLPPARDAKVPEALKDYIVNFPAPEDTDADFIDLQMGETPELPKPAATGGGGKTNFEQKNRRNKLTGDQGEDVVFLAEKKWLTKNGQPSLAKKVKAICREDDGAGYDILSFELDGTAKQIEVKATTAKPPGSNGSFHFHLSATEYDQAKKFTNFYIYVVFDVKSKKPKIWPIRNPASLEPKRLHLKASAYYATVTIA